MLKTLAATGVLALFALTGCTTTSDNDVNPAVAATHTYHFNVLSGQPHRVDTYYNFNDMCEGGPVRVSIPAKPKRGSFSTKNETTTISGANIGNVGNCNGKKVKGVAIYYVSNKGFRGKDRFVSTDNAGTTNTYIIDVH